MPLSSAKEKKSVGDNCAASAPGKKKYLSRNNLIEQLAKIPGIYAPAVHGKNQIIKKRRSH